MLYHEKKMHEKVQNLRLCPLIFKDFALQGVSLKGSVNTFLPLSFRGSFTKKESNKKSLCINRKWKKNFAMHGRTKFHAFSDKKRRREEEQKLKKSISISFEKESQMHLEYQIEYSQLSLRIKVNIQKWRSLKSRSQLHDSIAIQPLSWHQ